MSLVVCVSRIGLCVRRSHFDMCFKLCTVSMRKNILTLENNFDEVLYNGYSDILEYTLKSDVFKKKR